MDEPHTTLDASELEQQLADIVRQYPMVSIVAASLAGAAVATLLSATEDEGEHDESGDGEDRAAAKKRAVAALNATKAKVQHGAQDIVGRLLSVIDNPPAEEELVARLEKLPKDAANMFDRLLKVVS